MNSSNSAMEHQNRQPNPGTGSNSSGNNPPTTIATTTTNTRIKNSIYYKHALVDAQRRHRDRLEEIRNARDKELRRVVVDAKANRPQNDEQQHQQQHPNTTRMDSLRDELEALNLSVSSLSKEIDEIAGLQLSRSKEGLHYPSRTATAIASSTARKALQRTTVGDYDAAAGDNRIRENTDGSGNIIIKPLNTSNRPLLVNASTTPSLIYPLNGEGKKSMTDEEIQACRKEYLAALRKVGGGGGNKRATTRGGRHRDSRRRRRGDREEGEEEGGDGDNMMAAEARGVVVCCDDIDDDDFNNNNINESEAVVVQAVRASGGDGAEESSSRKASNSSRSSIGSCTANSDCASDGSSATDDSDDDNDSSSSDEISSCVSSMHIYTDEKKEEDDSQYYYDYYKDRTTRNNTKKSKAITSSKAGEEEKDNNSRHHTGEISATLAPKNKALSPPPPALIVSILLLEPCQKLFEIVSLKIPNTENGATAATRSGLASSSSSLTVGEVLNNIRYLATDTTTFMDVDYVSLILMMDENYEHGHKNGDQHDHVNDYDYRKGYSKRIVYNDPNLPIQKILLARGNSQREEEENDKEEKGHHEQNHNNNHYYLLTAVPSYSKAKICYEATKALLDNHTFRMALKRQRNLCSLSSQNNNDSCCSIMPSLFNSLPQQQQQQQQLTSQPVAWSSSSSSPPAPNNKPPQAIVIMTVPDEDDVVDRDDEATTTRTAYFV